MQEATRPVDIKEDPGPSQGLDLIGLLAAPGPMGAALRSAMRDLPPSAVPGLVERLVYHRIDGLAWRAIAGLPADEIDPWLRATLRRRHQQRSAAVLAQGLGLAEVLDHLTRAGVPVAVTRGLRVIEWIYRDTGARPFEDHDLLVRPADEPLACAVLQRLGYEERAPRLFRRTTITLDLHTDPLGARRRPTRAQLFPIDVEALFRDASPGWIAGGPAMILAPEDEILLLALHVVKHSFDRLIRTADLAHLVAVHGNAICWERVRERAEEARATRLLGLAFGAATPFGITVPAAVRLPEPFAGLEGLLLDRVRAFRPLPYCGEVLMAMAAPRFLDRLRYVLDALVPAGEAPAGGWSAAEIPRRSVILLDGAARRMRERRRA